MQSSDAIWFDGKLVPWAEANVHVTAHCLHYGSGVFEGIRAYATPAGPQVLALEEHLKRFERSCKVIRMPLPFDRATLREAVLSTVRHNHQGSCYVRPLAFRNGGGLGINPLKNDVSVIVASWEWATLHGNEAIEKGIDVGVSSWRRMAPDTHPAMAKAVGNYLNSQLVLLEALDHGYQEGLVLDTAGYVSEGSGENVFVVHEGRVITPPLGESILPGITRALVIRLLRERGQTVVEQRIAREMLYFADEIFLTGTAAEITPVRSVDRRPVGDRNPGRTTRDLQRDFYSIVRGDAPDRFGWMTPVQAPATGAP